MNDQDAVFAALSDGTKVRLTSYGSYDDALKEWYRLDDLRVAGHVITVNAARVRQVRGEFSGRSRLVEEEPVTIKHFVVRAANDPHWNKAREHQGSLFVLSAREYTSVENAARALAKSSGRFFAAVGGWVYNAASRQPLCQGWWAFGTRYAHITKVNGKYRYLAQRLHADWTLGRQEVTSS